MNKVIATILALFLAAVAAMAQASSFDAFLKSYESTPGCTYLTVEGDNLKAAANQFGGPAFAFVANYPNTRLHILALNRSQLDNSKWEELRQGAIDWLVNGTYLSLGSAKGMEYFVQRDDETVYAIFAISTTRLALIQTNIPLAEFIAAAQANEPKEDAVEIHDDVVMEEEVAQVQETPADDEPIPYQLVKTQPLFMGQGENAFYEWISRNVVYPELAKENGIVGDVIVQFTIYEDGTVRDVKVVRGVNPLLDNEAKRILNSCPKWTPGKQDGRPVKVTFVTKIGFNLR